MSSQGLPPATLYPIIFALISFVVIALFIGLSMAVRQQNNRNQRYLDMLQAQLDLADRTASKDEKPRPLMWEIIGEEEVAVGAGGAGKRQSTWNSGMSPASILPIPHHPSLRVLPSTAPQLLLSTIILQPRAPRHASNNYADDDDDEDDDGGPLGDAAGVEVDLGTEQVEVVGDWRRVVGRTDLGFEF